ncbi:MAG: transcription termination factor NusA [Aggregatilineales bacterium]
MRSEFEVAFNEITDLRALPRQVVLEALQSALISAYRRDTGASQAQRIDATIDPATGRPNIFVEKEVVEEVQNPLTEVDLEEARYYDQSAQYGDTVMVQVRGSTKKYGRIAAQTAKQVILQKIREAERNALFEEFLEREGDLVTGTVQSVNPNVVTLSLGRAEAEMPRNQQIPGERYKQHDKVRVYVAEVKRSPRGPRIIVSRSHRNMLRRLLEYEVPEIFNGQVEIKNIAREAGYRSKVAVAAIQEGIDPVGACVGMRGMRIQSIVKELHDEKIDVIEWNPDQKAFIAKALSPARVSGVYLEEDPDTGRTAVVIVPDDQLSLAIGREGQNARLAAKLTGWRIDIKSVTEAVQDALARLDTPPLASLPTQQPELLAETLRIMDKKAAGRTVMPEEYQTLARFADVVETRLLNARNQAREARIAEINAVKATLPASAFELPVTALDLPDEIIEALQPLENVGEIMWRFLIDETHLQKLLADLPPEAMKLLQSALDRLVIPEEVETPTPSAEETAAPVEPAAAAPELAPETLADLDTDVEVPALLDAFGDELAPAPDAATVTTRSRVEETAVLIEEEDEDEEDDGDIDAILASSKISEPTKKKKDRQKRRQLVFDEELGEVIAKRRRKGRRAHNDWDDFLG